MELLSLKHYHVGTMKNTHGIQKLKKFLHCLIPDSISCALFRYYFNKLKSTKGMDNDCLTSYDISSDVYLKSEWLEKTVELDFEGVKRPCPVNYDAYLRLYYGDYMQIPKDKTKHSDDPNVLIKLDECYEKYWS